MGRRNLVFSLPPELQNELNRRLRITGYAQLGEHSAWLASRGHPFGKSALGTHAARLLEEDAKDGVMTARLIKAGKRKQPAQEKPAPILSEPPAEAVTSETQRQLIERMLLAGEPVNAVTVFPLGITRPASHILRLRRGGWPVRTTKRHGNGMADYTLPQGWRPPDTKRPR